MVEPFSQNMHCSYSPFLSHCSFSSLKIRANIKFPAVLQLLSVQMTQFWPALVIPLFLHFFFLHIEKQMTFDSRNLNILQKASKKPSISAYHWASCMQKTSHSILRWLKTSSCFCSFLEFLGERLPALQNSGIHTPCFIFMQLEKLLAGTFGSI